MADLQTNSKKHNAILVAGYGNTGASVVIDILKECEGFACPDVEFYVAQHPDGIIGLENALINSWSDFSPDWAIRRFKKLIDILDRKGGRLRFGLNYNELISKEFKKISSAYIEKLTDFDHSGFLYFRRADMKILTRLFLYFADVFRGRVGKLQGNYKIKEKMFWLDTFFVKLNRWLSDSKTNMSSPGQSFFEITRNYFEELFCALDKDRTKHSIVLDQGTTAYQPVRIMKYFHSSKTIIVDRDPRDIYVSALKSLYMPIEVEKFIKWHKMTREMSRKATLDNQNVLRLCYEDLIFDYEKSCDFIFSFLGYDKSIHVNKGKYFVPEVSVKGTGKWNNCSLWNQVTLIEEELSAYIYNGSRELTKYQ